MITEGKTFLQVLFERQKPWIEGAMGRDTSDCMQGAACERHAYWRTIISNQATSGKNIAAYLVEGIHGEAKTQHGLRRAVRRGLKAVINLKRLATVSSGLGFT